MDFKRGKRYVSVILAFLIIILSCLINFFVIFYISKHLIVFAEKNTIIEKPQDDKIIIENNEIIQKPIDLTQSNLIINISEKDKDIIKEIFIKGMSLENINNVINYTGKYIESNENYIFLNYDFETKLTYEQIESYLYKLNNSNIVELEHIGSSVDNRNIYSIEIGTGKTKFMIDANIHAAETANTILLLKYIIELVNKYESNDKNVVDLLKNIKLVIIPCINPDGYEVYNFGIESIKNKNLWIYKNKDSINFENFKFNANGVDLNRNMPTQNAGLYYKKHNLISSVSKIKITSSRPYFGGYELGSEPETKSLMYFMLKHYKESAFYINMHSQGRVIYQGKPNLSNEFNISTKKIANEISKYNNYTPLGIKYEEVGQGNDGTASDFMAELAHGFSFSKETGRLTSTTTYELNGIKLKYKCPSITLETLNTYTKDINLYKNEYYNTNFYNMITDLMKKYSL